MATAATKHVIGVDAAAPICESNSRKKAIYCGRGFHRNRWPERLSITHSADRSSGGSNVVFPIYVERIIGCRRFTNPEFCRVPHSRGDHGALLSRLNRLALFTNQPLTSKYHARR
jgi:hypothetical protein